MDKLQLEDGEKEKVSVEKKEDEELGEEGKARARYTSSGSDVSSDGNFYILVSININVLI